MTIHEIDFIRDGRLDNFLDFVRLDATCIDHSVSIDSELWTSKKSTVHFSFYFLLTL